MHVCRFSYGRTSNSRVGVVETDIGTVKMSSDDETEVEVDKIWTLTNRVTSR